jgi:hypothetical protein
MSDKDKKNIPQEIGKIEKKDESNKENKDNKTKNKNDKKKKIVCNGDYCYIVDN